MSSNPASPPTSINLHKSEPRLSLESLQSGLASPPITTLPKEINGHSPEFDPDASPLDKLRRELEQTQEEKEQLAAQYRNLLAKLTTMRNTLGNKLKQDAEELDRREQLVQTLTAQNDDLSSTVETLRTELEQSSEDASRASRELDLMRNRMIEENTQGSIARDRELRETQNELERCRIQRDDWERAAMQDRVQVEELRTKTDMYHRDLNLEREAREKDRTDLAFEKEQSSNLQSVLEDFQASKDHELRQAVKDYKNRLDQVTVTLAEFKQRALDAELKLGETTLSTSRVQELEQEVKEKNLLIGKLRHEGVIMNEHLMEALRRLRRSSNETNVDRRLITNVLLQFLATPRADAKRFEMLQLLSTVLAWNDAEREKAGLQRSHPSVTKPFFWSRSSPNKPNAELDKSEETESFSRLWVEFLLTESNGGVSATASPSNSRSNASLPGSP